MEMFVIDNYIENLPKNVERKLGIWSYQIRTCHTLKFGECYFLAIPILRENGRE